MTNNPIDRYVVNDALTALAGGALSDDDLNDLTHLVADAIEAGALPDPDNAPVWVLAYEHKHGVDTFCHRTKDGALKHLHGIVVEWWDQEIRNEEIPGDPQEAIDAYFEAVEGEDYILGEAVVGP